MTEAGLVNGRLSGAISFDNANALHAQGVAAIEGATAEPVVFDLSGVDATNSVTVALMMAWFRAADQAGKRVAFEGISSDLHKIIEFSGLSELLLGE